MRVCGEFTEKCRSEYPALYLIFFFLQEKVYEELLFVFGNDKSRPPELEDLKQLVFLEQCIKETLRRFPPVPFILREAVEDIQLKGKLISI